jgi:adenylate kinase
MGPPGSNRKENALALAEHFGWSCISIGDLLKKEVSKKSDYGKAISDNIKNSSYGKRLLFLQNNIVDD